METALVVPSRVRWSASLIERSVANDDAYLEANNSAFCALTDFRSEYPITVDTGTSIDDALADMNRLCVHALLATQNRMEEVDPQVVGLITAYDIERERPHSSSWQTGLMRRKPLTVGEVMTPRNELSLVNYESLQTLTALDVYKMFQGTGLTHLLVVEMHGDDSAIARGLLSRAALTKRLRLPRHASQA
jgi:CBS domain-containing protein